jgi:hypothetical protein
MPRKYPSYRLTNNHTLAYLEDQVAYWQARLSIAKEIVKGLEEGKTAVELEALYGVKACSISQLRKENLPHKRHGNEKNNDLKEAIRQRLRDGATPAQVREEYGVKRWFVDQIRRKIKKEEGRE